MTQFAAPGDLAARLGITLTNDDQARATTLLQLASGLIQREARQTIELVTDDVLIRAGTADTRFRLPERPVVDVTTVMLDGTALTTGTSPNDYWLVGDCLIRPCGWGWDDEPVQVTYTHGFDPIPDAIRAVCLEATVRAWVNPGSVISESYGSETVTFASRTAAPSGLLLSSDEQRVIHDVLRRMAGTIALR